MITSCRPTLVLGGMLKEATLEDAKEVAQKLNLKKELVWKILEGKEYVSVTDMAMAVQRALSVPAPTRS